MVDALAESLAKNPYAIFKAGEVINPLVFEPTDGKDWYCSVSAKFADVLRPYLPKQVVEKVVAKRPDLELQLSFSISESGRVLTTTAASESPGPNAQQVSSWASLGCTGPEK